MLTAKYKIALRFLLLLGIVYCCIEANGEGDFYIYLSAAGDLSNGIDIYLKAYIDEQYHYYYSVLFAVFLSPFYTLNFYTVKLFWLLLNLGLYIHLLFMLYESEFTKALQLKQRNLFLLFVFVFSFRFFHENIHASQVTILILWCSVFSLIQITRGKFLKGALLLAIGINIKLLPLVFIPYLIYRGYFKAVFFTILFLIVAAFLPSLIIGHEYNISLLKSWWFMVNPTNKQHILDTDERSFHGLSTLLATLFVAEVPDMYAMSLRRNIADLPLQTLSYILMAVRGGLAILTMYFLGLNIFRSSKNNWSRCMEESYILLLIPLIFPHQQHYAFLFIAPAFAVCVYYLLQNYRTISSREKNLMMAGLIFIYLTSNLKILVGEFNGYYEHYKILSYGALLLIPLLLWIKRRSQPGPASA